MIRYIKDENGQKQRVVDNTVYVNVPCSGSVTDKSGYTLRDDALREYLVTGRIRSSVKGLYDKGDVDVEVMRARHPSADISEIDAVVERQKNKVLKNAEKLHLEEVSKTLDKEYTKNIKGDKNDKQD